MPDLYTERLIALGIEADRQISDEAIGRCNCMVRYNDGPAMPAIHRQIKPRGKGNFASDHEFCDPMGRVIFAPTTYEQMPSYTILSLMKERGEVYIGHIFGPSK